MSGPGPLHASLRDPVAPWGLTTPDLTLQQGALRLRRACTAPDLAAVAALRGVRFGAGQPDQDQFDPLCTHLMVEDTDQTLLATTRLRLLSGVDAFQTCYTGQFYDLAALGASYARGLEIGRLCLQPGLGVAPDAIRVLLAGMTRVGLAGGAEVLFGCASFHGADPDRHAPALAWLGARHLGPAALRPGIRARSVVRLADLGPPDADGGRGVPPLLRMYLGLGGWVSDHAVIDRALDTLHVLVAVPTTLIPAARRHRLEALAMVPAALPLAPPTPIS